jgi:hypothetical protein
VKDIATLHSRLSTSYLHLAQALGLKRRERPVLDLREYLAQRAQELAEQRAAANKDQVETGSTSAPPATDQPQTESEAHDEG